MSEYSNNNSRVECIAVLPGATDEMRCRRKLFMPYNMAKKDKKKQTIYKVGLIPIVLSQMLYIIELLSTLTAKIPRES
jgi:hypothetical protein